MGRSIAAALLVVLGLAQILGETLGSGRLAALGRISAASPFPRPFVPYNGIEFWRNRIRVEWRTLDGREGSAELDRATYARIGGPHVVPVSYSTPFTVAPVISSRYWTPALEHGFCRGGALARAFEIEAELDWVAVRIANPALHSVFRERHACR